jgi:hypothetical protein
MQSPQAAQHAGQVRPGQRGHPWLPLGAAAAGMPPCRQSGRINRHSIWDTSCISDARSARAPWQPQGAAAAGRPPCKGWSMSRHTEQGTAYEKEQTDEALKRLSMLGERGRGQPWPPPGAAAAGRPPCKGGVCHSIQSRVKCVKCTSSSACW